MTTAIRTAALTFSQTVHDLGVAPPFHPAHPDILTDVQRHLRLPPEMIEWYTVAEPNNVEIPSFGNRPTLLRARDLPEAQIGYRGGSTPVSHDPAWDSSWIVFGGEGRYPLVVRAAATHDPTIYYGAIQKRRWHITPLSSNLRDFLFGMTDYVRLYVADYNNSIHDKDGVLLPTFWRDFAALLDQYPGTAGRTQTWLNGWLGY